MRFLWLLPLLSFTAAAIEKGGTLYVRDADTALLKEPKSGSAKMATLQAGAEVIWQGVSEKDNRFHTVLVGGKKGFLARGDLTPHKPQTELRAEPPPPREVPFAQSGAAVTDGPPRARGNPAQEQAAAELLYLEALNRQQATPAAVEARRKALHAP